MATFCLPGVPGGRKRAARRPPGLRRRITPSSGGWAGCPGTCRPPSICSPPSPSCPPDGSPDCPPCSRCSSPSPRSSSSSRAKSLGRSKGRPSPRGHAGLATNTAISSTGSATSLSVVWGASLYLVMALGWTWCFAAAGTWSRTPDLALGPDVGRPGRSAASPCCCRPNGVRRPSSSARRTASAFRYCWSGCAVAERVLRRSRPDEPHGRMAPWRHPWPGLAGRAVDAVADSRFVRAFCEWLPLVRPAQRHYRCHLCELSGGSGTALGARPARTGIAAPRSGRPLGAVHVAHLPPRPFRAGAVRAAAPADALAGAEQLAHLRPRSANGVGRDLFRDQRHRFDAARVGGADAVGGDADARPAARRRRRREGRLVHGRARPRERHGARPGRAAAAHERRSCRRPGTTVSPPTATSSPTACRRTAPCRLSPGTAASRARRSASAFRWRSVSRCKVRCGHARPSSTSAGRGGALLPRAAGGLPIRPRAVRLPAARTRCSVSHSPPVRPIIFSAAACAARRDGRLPSAAPGTAGSALETGPSRRSCAGSNCRTSRRSSGESDSRTCRCSSAGSDFTTSRRNSGGSDWRIARRRSGDRRSRAARCSSGVNCRK